MWKRHISMEVMNSETLKVLESIHESLGLVYTVTDRLNKLKFKNKTVNNDLEKLLLGIAEAFREINDYLDWYKEIEVQYIQERDRETELETELDLVRQERDKLIQELSKRDTERIIKEFNGLSSRLLELVENNIKSLSLSERLKDKTGLGSPTLIKDLDTNTLVKDYIKAGYKLTDDLVNRYNEKYNITYHGLRLRLINAGIWKANKGGN